MPKVVVVGSINIDIVANTVRHPVLGETVFGTKLSYLPGGKGANQAVAAARSGAETSLVGNVGDDEPAQLLLKFLKDSGVQTQTVAQLPDVTSGAALITVDEAGENSIVIVPGANYLLTPSDIERVRISTGDVVVSQFEVPLETVARTFEIAKKANALTVLNPSPIVEIPKELLNLVDILVVNEIELSSLSGSSVAQDASIDVIGKAVSQIGLREDQTLVVTLGPRGSAAFTGAQQIEIKSQKVSVVDTTGAGDCFTGSLAARLVAQDSLKDALKYANAAASLCVQKAGAGPSMPTLAEVRESLT